MNGAIFSEIGQRISWTLVHSIWQFASVAVVLAAGLRVLRGRSPHVRYGFMLATMVVMAIGSVVTFCVVSPELQVVQSQVASASMNAESNDGASLMRGSVSASLPLGVMPESSSASEVVDLVKNPSGTGSLTRSTTDSFHALLVGFVQRWMNLILASWLIGMLVLSIRPLLGWRATRVLRSRGRTTISDSITAVTTRVADRLGVRRVIEVAQSSLVEVPTVIGWLKPLVLLPVSAVSGLSSEQLEAVIAHELAHVRRHDYLVNLFQLAMETVFFYHPAMWWVSHRMRVEREECCDDIAVHMTGDRVGYAKLLVWLEESRGNSAGQTLAMSAGGGSLLSRVRRIVSTPSETTGVGPLAVICIVSLVFVVGSVLASNASTSLAEETGVTDEQGSAVQVTDDLSVELLAVIPHQALAEKAWRPDGTPFDQAPSLPSIPSNSSTKTLNGFDLVVESKGLGESRNPVCRADGRYTIWNVNEDGLASINLAPREKRKSTTLKIGIPDKQWGPWVSVDAAGQIIDPVIIPPRLQPAHNAIRVHTAQPYGDGTILRWACDLNERDLATFDLVAIDTQGERHKLTGSTLWDDEDETTRSAEVFDQPLDQIDHFEYRLRPYRHWVTFENVSLEPSQRTNFKTTVESVAVPPADEKVSFSGRIVGPDGLPATTEGWMYYSAKHQEGSYLGTIGEFTDAFRFKSRPGESFLSFHSKGFAPTWTPKMEVGPGDVVEGIVLQLQAGEHVTIQIQDSDNNPVNRATLIAHPVIHGGVEGPNFPISVPTGVVRLEHLAKTEYRFGVEAAGFEAFKSGALPIPPDRRLVLTMQRARADDRRLRKGTRPHFNR